MSKQAGLASRALSVVTIVAIVVLALWLTPDRHRISAQDREHGNRQPLIARGYTDATAGTAIVAGDPRGGQTVVDLRIEEGQKVERGEIIAVLSNYPRAEVLVEIAETNLEKMKKARETLLTGPPARQIALSEEAIELTVDRNKLAALQRLRSGKPRDQKALEVSLAERGLANQKASLALQKRSYKNNLALNALDIARTETALESARADREASLVRSPVDGQVVDIYTRKSGFVARHAGIAKIVDMSRLRVLAEIDEVHLPRLVAGARVEVTFRGSARVYPGKIVRTPLSVTRAKRSMADLMVGSAHTVEVEIAFDDPSSVPQMLGREARVTFL